MVIEKLNFLAWEEVYNIVFWLIVVTTIFSAANLHSMFYVIICMRNIYLNQHKVIIYIFLISYKDLILYFFIYPCQSFKSLGSNIWNFFWYLFSIYHYFLILFIIIYYYYFIYMWPYKYIIIQLKYKSKYELFIF